jgi:hypothetical protein
MEGTSWFHVLSVGSDRRLNLGKTDDENGVVSLMNVNGQGCTAAQEVLVDWTDLEIVA